MHAKLQISRPMSSCGAGSGETALAIFAPRWRRGIFKDLAEKFDDPLL
jgi:hypothetical protein